MLKAFQVPKKMVMNSLLPMEQPLMMELTFFYHLVHRKKENFVQKILNTSEEVSKKIASVVGRLSVTQELLCLS